MLGAAFTKSSAIITGMNSTFALSHRKNGSAIAGICEASFMLTMMYAPRCPSIDAKYAASAPTSLRALWIFCPNPGSLIAAFPASTGISIFIRNRILVSLLVQCLFDQVLEYPHSIRNNPWHGRGVSGHVRLVDIGSTLTPNDAIDQSD